MGVLRKFLRKASNLTNSRPTLGTYTPNITFDSQYQIWGASDDITFGANQSVEITTYGLNLQQPGDTSAYSSTQTAKIIPNTSDNSDTTGLYYHGQPMNGVSYFTAYTYNKSNSAYNYVNLTASTANLTVLNDYYYSNYSGYTIPTRLYSNLHVMAKFLAAYATSSSSTSYYNEFGQFWISGSADSQVSCYVSSSCTLILVVSQADSQREFYLYVTSLIGTLNFSVALQSKPDNVACSPTATCALGTWEEYYEGPIIVTFSPAPIGKYKLTTYVYNALGNDVTSKQGYSPNDFYFTVNMKLNCIHTSTDSGNILAGTITFASDDSGTDGPFQMYLNTGDNPIYLDSSGILTYKIHCASDAVPTNTSQTIQIAVTGICGATLSGTTGDITESAGVNSGAFGINTGLNAITYMTTESPSCLFTHTITWSNYSSATAYSTQIRLQVYSWNGRAN